MNSNKHHIYILKKGDTLESISDEFGISINQLKSYHNKYCQLDQLIGGDKLPKNLHNIILSQIEKKKVVTTKESPVTLGENQRYQINIHNTFFIDGKVMSENQTENIWEITQSNDNYKVAIEVVDKKIVKSESQLAQLIKITDEINKSSDVLELRLNDNKTIDTVINKDDIWEKWEKIKFEKIKYYELQDDFLKIIVEQYDNAFQNITQQIKNNILYQLLLYPQNPIHYPQNKPTQLKGDFKTNSLIFPMSFIHYNFNYTSQTKGKDLIINLNSKLNSQTQINEFKENYKKGYSEVVKSEFKFDFKIEGKYIYDEDTKTLNLGVVYLLEQISKGLFFTVRYEFIRLDKFKE